MGLRDWLERQLSRGTPPEVHPDEMVELRTVHRSEGPMLVTLLRERGIDAASHPTFNPATQTRTDELIYVRRHQYSEASDILDSLRS